MEWNSFETLSVAGAEPLAEGLGDQANQIVPVVPASDPPARFDLRRRTGLRSKGLGESTRPLLGRLSQQDYVGEFAERTNRRSHDRPTARQVFMQLQRVDELRVVIQFVKHRADIEVLRVGRKLSDRLAAQEVHVGPRRNPFDQRGPVAEMTPWAHQDK